MISEAPTAHASSGAALPGAAPYWQAEHEAARSGAAQSAGAATGVGAQEALPMAPTHRRGEEASHQLHAGCPSAVGAALTHCQPQAPPARCEKAWHCVAEVLKAGAAPAATPSSAARAAQYAASASAPAAVKRHRPPQARRLEAAAARPIAD